MNIFKHFLSLFILVIPRYFKLCLTNYLVHLFQASNVDKYKVYCVLLCLMYKITVNIPTLHV